MLGAISKNTCSFIVVRAEFIVLRYAQPRLQEVKAMSRVRGPVRRELETFTSKLMVSHVFEGSGGPWGESHPGRSNCWEQNDFYERIKEIAGLTSVSGRTRSELIIKGV